MKETVSKIKKHNSQPLFLTFLIALQFLYYLCFINKGIVFSDEGVYTYTAEMITKGHIPYINFFLEYPPLYFYILAFFYKLFGPSILAGRALSLLFCVSIFFFSLRLLEKFGVNSMRAKIVALLCISSFGYPLITIPILTWPTVLITEILMLLLITAFQKPKLITMIFLGLSLAFLLAVKQNVALTQMLLVNLLLLLSLPVNFLKKVKYLFVMNLVWIGISGIWIYYFFLHNNISGLVDFLAFSSRLSTIYGFSYPPVSMIFQPLGLIKLLPYYLPIFFLLMLLYTSIKYRKDKNIRILFLPLCGFFTTIYPVSELLHVYPYFGLILVSLFIFHAYHSRFTIAFYAVLCTAIITGFYLTFFSGYYRSHPAYRLQNTALNLPKSQDIYIDKPDSQNISHVYAFLQSHTETHDYIFAYPFSPMQYFLFDRQNPSRYPIYAPGYLTIEQENQAISEIMKFHTKYIITDGYFGTDRPLAKWIIRQKKVKEYGPYVVYAVSRF